MSIVSSSSHAQATDDAEALYARGIEARQRRRDAEAVEAFRAAWELDGEPRALAQLGIAEQAVGRWVEAYTHLTEALALVVPWIESHREVLEQAYRVVAAHVGRLEVRGNVTGAEVRVDGALVGRLPMEEAVPVVIGGVVVEVRAPGYVAVQRSERVVAGGLARVSVRLVPELAAEEPRHAARATPTGPSPAATSSSPAGVSPLAASTGVAGALAALAWASFGAAMAVREDNVRIWNDRERCDPIPSGRSVACPDVHSAWTTAQDWALSLGIGAGLATLAAGALLVFTLTERPDVQIALAGPTVAMRLTFP